jgi:HK97 family phage portal protein
MSVLRRESRSTSPTNLGVAPRSAAGAAANVTLDTALRHSAIWAALRTRADLISTLPLDCYRKVGAHQLEVPQTPFLLDPAADGSGMMAWLYATQFDLDRGGNAFGAIVARDGAGRPSVVELIPAGDVVVKAKGPRITGYRVGGHLYQPDEIWHERQNVAAGIPVGLSPISYAAWSLGAALSAQQFALDWYSTGAQPIGTLRHTKLGALSDEVIAAAKSKWKAAVANRDMFVTGSDWEYSMSAEAASAQAFIEQQEFGVVEAARWTGVPVDIIDGAVKGSSLTYANISQRNLQLLIINLGPSIGRREYHLSSTVAAPRFVKLNTDAMLRMDPETRARVVGEQIATRQIAPSEARALDNRMPFTDEQYAEFDRLFGKGTNAPAQVTKGPTA